MLILKRSFHGSHKRHADASDGTKADSTEAIKATFGDDKEILQSYFDAKETAVRRFYRNMKSQHHHLSEEYQDIEDVGRNELFEIWKSREELLPEEAASYYPKGHPKNPISDSQPSNSGPSNEVTMSESNTQKTEKVTSSEVEASSATTEESVSQSPSEDNSEENSTVVSFLIDIVKDIF